MLNLSIGDKIGKLEVLEILNDHYGSGFRLKCECGRKIRLSEYRLINCKRKSCGCEKKDINNHLGKTFNRLTIINFSIKDGDKSKVIAKCKCGKTDEFLLYNIVSGHTKSCGCLLLEFASQNGKKQYPCGPFGIANRNALISRYKSNAYKRHLDFHLTIEECEKLFQGKCHYCSCEPSQIIDNKGYHGVYIYNGIDRLNNKMGYQTDNCVSCCKRCNIMKGVFREQEFYNHINKVYKNIYGRIKEI